MFGSGRASLVRGITLQRRTLDVTIVNTMNDVVARRDLRFLLLQGTNDYSLSFFALTLMRRVDC